MSFEIEKPHGGDHRFFLKQWTVVNLWIPAGFFIVGFSCRRTSPCEEKGCNESAAPPGQIFVIQHSSWASDDVGFFFCNNCSVGDSGLMSLMSKEKQSCHCLMFLFFILINVIPSSVCPHVCSIHLHVYYLIFHIVHRSHYLVN